MELDFRNMFSTGVKDMAIGKVEVLNSDKSNIMQCFQPVLRAWWHRVQDKATEWTDQVIGSAPVDAVSSSC